MSAQVVSLASRNICISHSTSWNYIVEGHMSFFFFFLLCSVQFMIHSSVIFFPAIRAIPATQLVILCLCHLVDCSFLSLGFSFILYISTDSWTVHAFEAIFISVQAFSNACNIFHLKIFCKTCHPSVRCSWSVAKYPAVSLETKCK